MSKSVVDKINEANAKKYGEMQLCCGLFKTYCRCEIANIEATCHVDNEVYNWFQQKLVEASKISADKIPNIKATTLGLELPTLDIKTGKLKWSIWQKEFWQQLKFWK